MTSPEQGRLAPLLARGEVAALMAALNRDGEEARIVGGAVRNALLGEDVADIDVATTALPEETVRRAKAAGFKPVPTGIEHGTITVVVAGMPFEVTTLRRDVETDGRHAVVAFGRDFREDALRRDFTINALGLDADGALHDYAGGVGDLAARRVRFIGQARERIAEDYLRILRFFRFHARYGAGEPDKAALEACTEGRAGLEGLSRERVRAELLKLLAAPRAASTLRAMAGAGLLVPVIGGVPQLSRFEAIAGDGEQGGDRVHPDFRLAALAVLTREDAARLREKLRLSNAESGRIEAIALALETVSGRESLPALAELRETAHGVGTDAVAAALVLLNATAGAARAEEGQTLIAGLGQTPRFLPSGKDLLALGVAAGPLLGQVLEQARRDWIAAGCPAGRDEQMTLVAKAAAMLSPA